MSKYLKLFETVADYTAAENTLVKPNVSLIEETNKVEYNPYIPPQPITYTASGKLNVTWTDEIATFGATIKSHTFENGVGTIEFNDNVTNIGESAFYQCSSLTSVTIPNSVTTIGRSAFYLCQSLASITIPNSVRSIGDSAFYACSSLTNVTIPNSVTSIGESAFQYCTKLTSITIPNSVTNISNYAFGNCTNSTSITIPNSVTSIGDNAFRGCRSLTNINIPNSVTIIGGYAFFSCGSLISVTVEATTPPTLESYYGTYGQFGNNASDRKIYVPSASVNAYKAASGWSIYASDIEAIPTN